ncbi:HD domain protein [uncultured delta proteobacterium]|uniref:HD domain protein n=1 Tax=uncultured delta proteobacterium TaxID=34034 RepID=A0A212JHL5_9DELT|nr:HD domain protein [uncultured delta proteobacterium]
MQPAVPENISEEYYQISEAILSSFPKYRPPLDLFRLKEDIAQLQLFIKKDTRITNEQIEEIFALCKEENLFVSRADFPVYSKHIVKQLDLVLVDKNLKEGEVADITLDALGQRLTDFYDQPVKPVFDNLYEAVQVVTEYIWQDKHRLRLYLRRLYTGEHSFIHQSLNSFSVGLWLLCKTQGEELRRKEFDKVAMGLVIHDVGMSKVPSFILSKTGPLKPEEKEKIPPHPIIGMKIAQKLEIVTEEIRGIVLEHQERMDGSGYPQRIKGNDISRLGRLAAVADSFAAMIQKRPYAEAMPPVDAAKALANDKARYDAHFTIPLMTAYVVNDFSC